MTAHQASVVAEEAPLKGGNKRRQSFLAMKSTKFDLLQAVGIDPQAIELNARSMPQKYAKKMLSAQQVGKATCTQNSSSLMTLASRLTSLDVYVSNERMKGHSHHSLI